MTTSSIFFKPPPPATTTLWSALEAPFSGIVVILSFDDGPGFTCWHTDCYRFADGTWQVVWSQATEIAPLR